MIPATPEDWTASATLTPREREVLILVSKGLSIRQIADGAGIKRLTVNDHLKSIYRKLGVGTRVEAAVIATKVGLV